MNARTASLMAAVLTVAPLTAFAEDAVAQLARDTGLTERNVRMVLGARTPYAEYRTRFDRVTWTLKRAVGDANYRRLMNGEEIVLQPKTAPDAAPTAAAKPADTVRQDAAGGA